jgi:hypothetical protein
VRLTLIIVILVAGLTTAAVTVSGEQTPSQQIAQLKKQLRTARLNNADLQDQVDALNAVSGDQADQIARLQGRIANAPDPLDVITSRGPDGLWNAMRAIWLAFPTLDPTQLCGYDRSFVPGDGDGLTLTSFTFYKWQGC